MKVKTEEKLQTKRFKKTNRYLLDSSKIEPLKIRLDRVKAHEKVNLQGIFRFIYSFFSSTVNFERVF